MAIREADAIGWEQPKHALRFHRTDVWLRATEQGERALTRPQASPPYRFFDALGSFFGSGGFLALPFAGLAGLCDVDATPEVTSDRRGSLFPGFWELAVA